MLQELKKAGATINKVGGKGSHRKVTIPSRNQTLIISGKEGDDVKRYQEKALKDFLGK